MAKRTEDRSDPIAAEMEPGTGALDATDVVMIEALSWLFRASENRYVEPGEKVALEPETAAMLVELGVARLAEGTV